MAQEVPLLPPPGLDRLTCKQEDCQVAQESSRKAFARAVHEKVQHELDERVATRLDELWTKGQQVLLQSHQRHGDATRKLQKELGECRTKQQLLEAQNEQLKQMLQTLTFRLSFLGQVFGSKDGCSEVLDDGTLARETSAGSAGSCAPETRSASEFSQVAGSLSPAAAPAPPPGIPSHVLGTPTEASWLPSAAPISLAEALGGVTPDLAQQMPPVTPLPTKALGGLTPDLSQQMPPIPPLPTSAPPPDLPSHILGSPTEAPPPGMPSHVLGTPTEASWLPSAAPISLAEALGGLTPELSQQMPQIPPLPALPVPPVSPLPMSLGSPVGSVEQCSGTFTFTLRKADGADLGLHVSHREPDMALHVIEVRPGGAVDAWNRQCAGTACSEKAVKAGDDIISVNMITGDPARMLEECRDKQLLKLVIVRGDSALPAVSNAATLAATAAAAPTSAVAQASPRPSGSLRADACEFVPSSMAPTAADTGTKPLEA